jgi:hypothetical protein
MVRVSALPYLNGMLPCGEARGSGHFSVLGCDVFGPLLIFEDTGHNSYREYVTRDTMGYPFALGFGNTNGLSDVVTSPEQPVLQVWEAAAPDSFPSHLVFADTSPSGIGIVCAQFCDMDRDGLNEIVADRYGIEVWENEGNNHYIQVPFPLREDGFGMGIADFDRDSLMEIGNGDGYGWLHFWECLGHDQYVVTCSMPPRPDKLGLKPAAARLS